MKNILLNVVTSLVVVIMVIFLISCSGTPGATTASETSATQETSDTSATQETSDTSATQANDLSGITITMLGTTEPTDNMIAAVIPFFEEETGAKVNFEQIGLVEQMNKARLEYSKGSKQYDIILISSYDSSIYYGNNWCEDLDALEKSTGISFERDTFMPGVLENAPCQWNGVTLGLPTMCSTNGVLLYRKDLMENQEEKDAFKAKYGYELTPPINWDQYYDVAEFFTRKAGDKLGGEVLTSDFYGAVQHFAPDGSIWDAWLLPYMTSDTDPTADPKVAQYTLSKDLKPVFNNKAGVDALDYLKRLYDNGYLYPGALSISWATTTVPFNEGSVFMTNDWAENCISVMDPVNNPDYASKMAWAKHPYNTNARINQGGWVTTINKNSENKEAAYQFIVWLCSQETEVKELQSGEGFRFPWREKNFHDSSLMKGYEFWSVVGEMMEEYSVSPEGWLIPEVDLIKTVLNVELQRAITGEKTSQQALDDAADAIVQGLTEAGAYDRLEQ